MAPKQDTPPEKKEKEEPLIWPSSSNAHICDRCYGCLAAYKLECDSKTIYLCCVCHGKEEEDYMFEELHFLEDIAHVDDAFCNQHIANEFKFELRKHVKACKSKCCPIGRRCRRMKPVIGHYKICNTPMVDCGICHRLSLVRVSHGTHCAKDDCTTRVCKENKGRLYAEFKSSEDEKFLLEDWNHTFEHYSYCHLDVCSRGCMAIKRQLEHWSSCREAKKCTECDNFDMIIGAHASECRNKECTVPSCQEIQRRKGETVEEEPTDAEKHLALPTTQQNVRLRITPSELKHFYRLRKHGMLCKLEPPDECSLFKGCFYARSFMEHLENCDKQLTNECDGCRCQFAVSKEHAKNCTLGEACLNPFCEKIKRTMSLIRATRRKLNVRYENEKEEEAVKFFAKLPPLNGEEQYENDPRFLLYIFQGILCPVIENKATVPETIGKDQIVLLRFEAEPGGTDDEEEEDAADESLTESEEELPKENFDKVLDEELDVSPQDQKIASAVLYDAIHDPSMLWTIMCLLKDKQLSSQLSSRNSLK